MHYYDIALINSPLNSFTYQSQGAIEIGTKVKVKVKNRDAYGVVLSIAKEPDFKTCEILEVDDLIYSDKQLSLAKFISSYYFCSLGEALGIMLPYVSTHSYNKQGSETQSSAVEQIALSAKQNEAFEFLKKHKTALLFGDTGSGKTEIYMKYFGEMIEQQKRSIFLMPEISLTPQMNQRLHKHFGDAVVMWHSKLTPKQKREVLEKIYDGSAKIIAGPRSALFLPIKDLGLIVVDEEHDESYKSSSRPRYNARDIAIYMGKLYDVAVVLGSATPSLTSYVKFPHFRLKGGHFSSKKEFMYERSSEKLSPMVLGSLQETLAAKEQAILFLPTRANFKYLICSDCGHTYKCVFCSVGMSIHHKTRSLKCHYCNFAQAIPQECPECKSPNLVSSRLGTAEVVKDIQNEFDKVM